MDVFKTFSPEAKATIVAGVVLLSMPIARTLMWDSASVNARAAFHRAQFLLFINFFMLAGSLFIWKRTVTMFWGARTTLTTLPWISQGWRAFVLLFLLLAHTSFFTMFYLVSEEPYWLALVSYTCLGAYIILVFFLLTFECLSRCHRTIIRVGVNVKLTGTTGGETMGYRPVSNKLTVLAIALTVTLCICGLLNASLPPEVVQQEISLDKLPRSLDRLKVVLLSDIHLGSSVGKSRLELIVSMVNKLEADVVVITGDLADSQVSRLLTASEPLRHIKSKLGSYFVTGNHDYYTADVEEWFALLRSVNIQPLHNDHVRIFRPGNQDDWLCLAGVDDLEAALLRYPEHGMNVQKALDGCRPEKPIVLLAHQPRAAYWALQERPDISLVLSGHTHAGQIFPLSIMAYLVNPYFRGLYHVGEKSAVYVSPGTAHYGMPMRTGSRAEITEILLRAP